MNDDTPARDANRSLMGTHEDPSAQTLKRNLQEDPEVPEPMEETLEITNTEENRRRSEDIRGEGLAPADRG